MLGASEVFPGASTPTPPPTPPRTSPSTTLAAKRTDPRPGPDALLFIADFSRERSAARAPRTAGGSEGAIPPRRPRRRARVAKALGGGSSVTVASTPAESAAERRAASASAFASAAANPAETVSAASASASTPGGFRFRGSNVTSASHAPTGAILAGSTDPTRAPYAAPAAARAAPDAFSPRSPGSAASEDSSARAPSKTPPARPGLREHRSGRVEAYPRGPRPIDTPPRGPRPIGPSRRCRRDRRPRPSPGVFFRSRRSAMRRFCVRRAEHVPDPPLARLQGPLEREVLLREALPGREALRDPRRGHDRGLASVGARASCSSFLWVSRAQTTCVTVSRL